MNKLIEFIFDEYGTPKKHTPLTNSELRDLPTSLPISLIELYQSYGRFTLQNGRLQICHPDDFKGIFSIAFGNDKDFNKDTCHAFAYSAFGTVYFYHNTYGCGDIDFVDGHLYSTLFTSPAKEKSNPENTIYLPFALDSESLDYYDTEDKPLFLRARKKLGSLDIGECYGFVPALSLAGEPRIENLKKSRAIEHLAILSQTQDIQLINSSEYGKSTIVRKIG
jgi:hypothetical protein